MDLRVQVHRGGWISWHQISIQTHPFNLHLIYLLLAQPRYPLP